ncbi:MAG: aldose 1-epimerase family protein, partial [Chloroflexota bacterium]
MVEYMGREWGRDELAQYVGHMRQIAGIKALEHTDGTARGSRLLQVYTGSGLSFEVLPDRALDISHVTFKGMSLSWQSSAGNVHPAYYEADGLGWLRSFPGGLMTTCGMDTFGAPSEDGGEAFGIHGRVGNIPAEQVSYFDQVIERPGDESLHPISINGLVRQSRLFGENLVLKRVISTGIGSNTIMVNDVVVNDGFAPQPHMMLYHCNLGFPLLSEHATLEIDSEETVPRDAEAEKGVDSWMQFQKPTPGYAEQVFRHKVRPYAKRMAQATLRNEQIGLALTIRYSHETLPHLFQWKQMGQGAYVLGIEPANSSAVEGRATARERDDLPMLEPGESRQYSL